MDKGVNEGFSHRDLELRCLRRVVAPSFMTMNSREPGTPILEEKAIFLEMDQL